MKKLLYFSLFLLLFTACRKDNETLRIEETTYNPPIIEITGTIIGTVIDENNQPLEGASVSTFDGAQTTSDQDGIFYFRNIPLNQNGTYVKVEKSGFFHNSSIFYPTIGSTNRLVFKMIDATPTGSFNSADGGSVSLQSGTKLDIPANSVVDGSNNPYNGNVNVAITWLDPTADDLDLRMPGGLLGFDNQGLVQGLETYGMIGVELTDDNGNELNIGNGGMADLSFPVPTTLANNAPAEIPLWHFDETEGIWKEEGKATLQGDFYVGQVSHFSFWNCDAPFPLINLTGRLVTSNGNPLTGVHVRIVRDVSGGRVSGSGRTNDDGVFGGKVPKDETLTLEVLDECLNVIYTQDIGPFSSDVDLGDIVVSSASSQIYSFTATVEDCNNSPLTNGIFKYRVGGIYGAVFIDDGTVDIEVLVCDNTSDFNYYAVNLDDLEESDQLSQALSGNTTVDLGNIVACGNQLTEFFTLNIGSETKTYIGFLQAFGGTAGGGTNFSISDSSQNSTYIFFGLAGTSTGVYTDSTTFIEVISDLDFGVNGISGTNELYFDQIEITEYGAVGELIKGTLQSSSFDYLDGSQNPVTGQTLSGSFAIRRVR